MTELPNFLKLDFMMQLGPQRLISENKLNLLNHPLLAVLTYTAENLIDYSSALALQ